jgi:hypothetical protein
MIDLAEVMNNGVGKRFQVGRSIEMKGHIVTKSYRTFGTTNLKSCFGNGGNVIERIIITQC